MCSVAFSNLTAIGLALAEESGSTIAERLSHDKLSQIYLSEIKRAVEGIGQPAGYKRGKAYGPSYSAFVREGEEEIKRSSWSEQRIAMELLPKLYIRDLLQSWKCGPEIDGLISRIRQNAEGLHADHIAQRLNQLWKVSEVEEPDNCAMSSDSLRSFERFANLYPRVRYPDITLTPGGHVYARWKGSRRSLLSIQFLPEMKVRFVVFAPNQRHPEELNRASGTDFVETVMDNLSRAYGVSDWVLE